MRSIEQALLVAIVVGVSGCSSSSDPGRGDSTAPAGAGSPTGTAGTTGFGAGGTGAPTGAAANSGFFNPTTTPTQMAGPVAGAGGGAAGSNPSGCADGQFCASANPDQGCGEITNKPTQKMTKTPGNVLLVWDRSTSMMQDWNGMIRWQAAGTALIAALTPLAADLKIGGIFFPSVVSSNMQRAALGPFSCDVDAYNAPGQIPFMPGPDFLSALQKADPSGAVNPIYSAGPAQATPTYAALAEADKAIQYATLQGTLAIVLVTDGEPTCTDWDQNAANTMAANWLKMYQAKTYVVGLPSMDIQAGGQSVLNGVAQAGGTDKYIDPSDPATLQQQINQIVSTTISSSFDSCAFDLMPPTGVPDKLQLVVQEQGVGQDEEVPHDLGGVGGWTITPDGTHIELTGGVCNSAKSGAFSSISFKYGCKDVPMIMPSHVK